MVPDLSHRTCAGINLQRSGTRTQGREKLFELLHGEIPPGATLLLSFGEIDCRAHLIRQAETQQVSVQVVVDACLDAYFKVVRELLALGHSVIVYNAVPSSPKTRILRARSEARYTTYGTRAQRDEVIRRFNLGARTRCLDCGAKFLGTATDLTNRRGKALRWYFFDSIHLSQRAMPVTLARLAAMLPAMGFPEDCPTRPGFCRVLGDWLVKRGRRIRKECAKLWR